MTSFKAILSILSICLLISSCQPVEKEYNIGQKSYQYIDSERDRPLDVEVWYPTVDNSSASSSSPRDIFKKLNTIEDATVSDQQFPILFISHGTGGNRFSLTWFIERVVPKGYIVVSLGHYGNTTFHKLPREFVKWWERAIDVQFVMDQVLADAKFKDQIDTSKIGGVGFSLGGYTNIALAGGQVDRTYHEGDRENKKRELPPEFPKTDEVIDFATDSLILASYERYKDQVKEDRIKAFFVMAPAVGFGFHTKEQTRNIKAPVYIVAGKGDTNTPIKHNALVYDSLIETSQLHLFGEHVDHYIFLNEATEYGKKIMPHITIDHPDVDRKKIHDEVAKMALEFFEENLKE